VAAVPVGSGGGGVVWGGEWASSVWCRVCGAGVCAGCVWVCVCVCGVCVVVQCVRNCGRNKMKEGKVVNLYVGSHGAQSRMNQTRMPWHSMVCGCGIALVCVWCVSHWGNQQ